MKFTLRRMFVWIFFTVLVLGVLHRPFSFVTFSFSMDHFLEPITYFLNVFVPVTLVKTDPLLSISAILSATLGLIVCCVITVASVAAFVWMVLFLYKWSSLPKGNEDGCSRPIAKR